MHKDILLSRMLLTKIRSFVSIKRPCLTVGDFRISFGFLLLPTAIVEGPEGWHMWEED